MMQRMPLAVLLVDDQPSVLWGLEKLIEGEWPRMAVAGTAFDAGGALRMARRLKPDVIVMDFELNGDSSLEFLPALRACAPTRIVMLSNRRSRELYRRALRDGAHAVVSKAAPAAELLAAIAGRERNSP